jgi:hypothetical protein
MSGQEWTDMNMKHDAVALNMSTSAIGHCPVLFNVVRYEFNCDLKPSLVSVVIYCSLMMTQYGPKHV